MDDLISRSALLETGSAKKINEAVEGWNELPSNAKAACIRLARETKKLVMAAPAVDAVEVVRCTDCSVPHNKWIGCPNLNGLVPPPDFFCARGERRADDGRSKAD